MYIAHLLFNGFACYRFAAKSLILIYDVYLRIHFASIDYYSLNTINVSNKSNNLYTEIQQLKFRRLNRPIEILSNNAKQV